MNAEIFAALAQLEKERGIPQDYMLEKITQALIAAYKKDKEGYTDNVFVEIKDNDIPDIINRFRNLDGEAERQRTEKSFFVSKDEIVENGYDLSINKYKKTEYVAVEYPSTTEILADLHELEMQITAGLAELEGML